MDTLKICENLLLRYKKTRPIRNYFGLLAYYALAKVAVEGKNEELLKECKTYLDRYPHEMEHPYYNFESYRVGGIPKAWLASQGLYDEALEDLREYAELTLNAPKDRAGIICHPTSDKEKIWIDVVMPTTPFMLNIGMALGEQKYIDFAAEQCFKMYETFLDKTNGLLHQSRGFMADPTRISPDHWGRGNGWGFIGLTALVEDLPADSIHREKAETYFKDLARALLPWQNERGAWCQEICSEYSWDESSATGLIAYCYGVGMRLGLLERKIYEESFNKALDVIVKRFINADFSVNMCCPGCLCPGEGESKGSVAAYLTAVQPVYNDSHAFAPMMLAMLEAHRNGITELGEYKWG